MKKSINKLEQISKSLNTQQTYYQFNKQDEFLSEKYRKGRISAAKWLNELIYYFIQKENHFVIEFKEHIQEQRKKLSSLDDGDFKQGLIDQLNTIEEMLNDRNHNS